MCCRNRRACGGRRRQGPLVALGALAYAKYQERKAEKALLQQQDERRASSGSSTHRSGSPVLGGNVPFNNYEQQQPSPAYYGANVNEKATYQAEPQQQPPSYAYAVNGAQQQQQQQRNIFEDNAEDLSDAESFYDVVDGQKRDSRMVREASDSFISKMKARRASGEKQFSI